MRHKKKISGIFLIFVFGASLLFNGCESNPNNHSKSLKSDTSVHIKALDGLKYNIVRFNVQPETPVSLTFINTSDMDHNFLIGSPGSRKEIVKQAIQLGANGPGKGYIPSTKDVLWHTALLSPGDSETITFTTPKKEGAYPYVCSVPGHGNTMYGVMYVTQKNTLPPLEEDANIPSYARPREENNDKKQHPYEVKPPYLIRTFMPDCSPAAIAVLLSDSLSYCWDAGSGRLRYIWSGEFLKDEAKIWTGKGNRVAQVAGEIFYRDRTKYPFRIGRIAQIPKVKFKGYRMKNHYPEFQYQWDSVNVYEWIKPLEDGSGIIRTFKVAGLSKPVWFVKKDSGDVGISASAGVWHGNNLQLTPAEARSFSLTITKN